MDEEIAGMVVKLAMEDGSFQEGIANLNRQMKVVDSEFKAATNGSKEFGSSLDGLKSNADRLSKVLEIQNQLIHKYQERLNNSKAALERNVQAQEKLKKEIDEAKRVYETTAISLGKNSTEAIKLKTELDKLEKTYDGNNQKIRNNVKVIDNQTIALNQAVGKLREFEGQLNEVSNQIDDFDKNIKKVGESSTQSIGTLNVAMGNLISSGIQMTINGLQDLAREALEFAADIEKLSLQTGMTKEELQQWDYVLKQTGSSIREADGDLAMLAERINEANMGTGEGKEVWDQLGISVVEASGKLKSQGQVLNETILALQNMEDVTKRNALASQLLGTTGENLMPILNMTNEQLAAMKGNAKVVSDQDLARLNSFKRTLQEFCEGTGKELIGILADIAAILQPIVEIAGMILEPILEVVHGFTEAIADAFGAVPEEYDQLNANAKGGLTKLEKSTDDSFSNMTDTVNDSYDEMKASTDEAFGYMDKAINGYLSDYEKNIRKELESMYGDSISQRLKMEEKISRIMSNARKDVEEKVQAHVKGEQAITKNLQEEINKRENLYKNNSYAKVTGIPAYEKGTQFHAGGLALVGERGPEIVNLPRGTAVTPTEQTKQQVANATVKSGPIFTGPIYVQANNVQEFIDSVKMAVISGEFA